MEQYNSKYDEPDKISWRPSKSNLKVNKTVYGIHGKVYF
jgi:hypothetical protein